VSSSSRFPFASGEAASYTDQNVFWGVLRLRRVTLSQSVLITIWLLIFDAEHEIPVPAGIFCADF